MSSQQLRAVFHGYVNFWCLVAEYSENLKGRPLHWKSHLLKWEQVLFNLPLTWRLIPKVSRLHVCYLDQQYRNRFCCMAKQQSFNSVLKTERSRWVWCVVFPRTQCMMGKGLCLSTKHSYLLKKTKISLRFGWQYIQVHITNKNKKQHTQKTWYEKQLYKIGR